MKILDRLAYAGQPTMHTVQGEPVRVKPYQIVVQIALSSPRMLEWDPRSLSFPAVLDTGNNHNLSIAQSQLLRWAGLHQESLAYLGAIRERGRRLPLHSARLWLHANAGTAEPVCLEVPEGIAIHPDETAPRLPVLGLRALSTNKLHLIVDTEKQFVHLRTEDVLTKILRWIC